MTDERNDMIRPDMGGNEVLDRIEVRARAIEQATRRLDESTGASWFWAFLFGPLWFLWIGAIRHAVISFVLCLLFVGIIINPFMAYAAHRAVARQKAEAYV